MCYYVNTGGVRMSNINIRVDDKLKNESQEIFKELGLDMSTGIKLYLNQVVKRKGIPFEVTLEKSEMELALEDIAKGRVESFDSLEDLMKDLNDDED